MLVVSFVGCRTRFDFELNECVDLLGKPYLSQAMITDPAYPPLLKTCPKCYTMLITVNHPRK